MINKRQKNNRGFFVLTMTLLVSAVILALASGVFLRSIDEVNQSADSKASLQAWATVNACGEKALLELSTTTNHDGWSYAGGEPLAVGDETCYIYPVVDGTDGVKLITASSTVTGFTRKISIEVATNTPMIVNSWQVVADF